MKFEEKPLSSLGQVITGKTPSTKKSQFWDGDILFVTPKDVQSTKHIFQTERNITQLGLSTVIGSALPIGAICVSCIGNIGYVGMTTKNCVSNQQINSIIVNQENDKDFVYYLIKNLWSYFKNYEGQSTALSI
ncbi:MAG: restriction endonuclease subunit S, partial [Clostridia bacterium]|nr:restriction endonuclease subunit S [Clostridia bacterium]